ncbi:helix-turn-helix transcriptional regulator [Listeria innocua]|uniref:helix-turn-helix domain-containing protein n=1 Tax=Listeria TaxID=1637 RepID=UPI000F1AF3FF|nr:MULTISPECIES: helix-turn-helix transcriptional regulator [Listeria]EAD5869938.1 XRE family transcriptional regulator [Listeria innocua]EAD9168672.1 XRE family transcriptional regulator [Listeria monocytogenes]EAF2179434.1 XRE family transcriptional regulator [Listeria monocytogenes]EAF5676674.1 XRE family transcriptional regulator [Listeria innocua]EAV9812870.1 helix-turn-helix transcriptional regulator [Listeria monocytogenes]
MQKIRPDLDIGKNIQQLRNDCKMTQDQVVAKLNIMGLNISKSTYAKIETNRMNVRVSELVVLKTIFNTGFDNFFDDLPLK